MIHKKKYPQSWPGFEIVGSDSEQVRNGAHVEAFGQSTWVKGRWWRGSPRHLGVRVVRREDITSTPGTIAATYDVYGFFGCQVDLDDLRPLTSAAKQMLAIARSAK